MLVKYINRMASSASAMNKDEEASQIDEEASAIDDSEIEALYEYLKKQSSAYTQEDIQDSSVVSKAYTRANRKSVYKFKPSIIGDVKFFSRWIEHGAHVAVIEEFQQPVVYNGKTYYTEEINKDGNYNLSNGKVASKLVILHRNIPYGKLILPDSHFIPGSLSIYDLQSYLKRLRLSAQNTSTVLLTLSDNQNVLYDHYNIGRRNRLTQQNVKEWLSKQANQIFDKIKEFNSEKQKLRDINRNAVIIIINVKTILDKFVSKVLQPIIPQEVNTYMEMERERERRVVANAVNSNVKISHITGKKNPRDEIEDKMLTKRLNRSNQGGKSMKPKQHRNSKTQKKRQHKNQKK